MGMRVSLAFFFSFLHFFTSFSHFSLFFPLFPLFPVFLYFCFLHFFTSFSPFSHYFPFFHLFSLSFFAFFFALSLTWPRPQPCRLTLPSLTLPHITSPLLSFLNTIKKKGASGFSADFCVKKFLPTKKADHFKVYPYV